MTAIVINTLFLCADYYGKGEKLTEILSQANLSFVVFFAVVVFLFIIIVFIYLIYMINYIEYSL